MYIHLGGETVINEKDVVGIFDLESTTISKNTRIFLNKAEKNKEVVNVSYELPKSFTVCEKNKEKKVYISQISATTLYNRSRNFNEYNQKNK